MMRPGGALLVVSAASFAVVRSGLAALPEGVNWTALSGCACLGGIGFTMSLFIATLGFEGTSW
jgi:Na+:H+ antiporter, NhaA family